MMDGIEVKQARPEMTLVPVGGRWPRLGAEVWLAPGARLVGEVTLGDRVSVWYNAVVRGDINSVTVGDDTNIQDNAVLHVAHGSACLRIGARVTIGHGAIVHGCTVGDEVLVGMGSIIMDGAVLGDGAIIAAGAVVNPGMVVPPGMVAMGVPARVVREVRPEEREAAGPRATSYVGWAEANRRGVEEAARLGE